MCWNVSGVVQIVNFHNVCLRNRRDQYQNGDAYERDDWGRGGGRYQDRERDLPRNDRWQEPERPARDAGGSGGGGGGGGRWNNDNNSRWNESRERRNDNDWTIPTPKDPKLELELFGSGNTGINFSKYEDIPVEATGHDIPPHITSVSKRDICISEILFFVFFFALLIVCKNMNMKNDTKYVNNFLIWQAGAL